jgi:hypothetical protein
VDRVLTSIMCGLAGAVALGILGAPWGGTVRVMANLRFPSSDAPPRQWFCQGARSGAGFLFVLGGLVGVLMGVVAPSREEAFMMLAAIVYSAAEDMFVIVVRIGLPATGLVWLAGRLHARARKANEPSEPV